eukprot:jgi/Picsp_1/2668/NSC_00898-R1_kelch repeat
MGSLEEDLLNAALQRAGSASCSHEEGHFLLFGGNRDKLYFKDCWEYRPEVGKFFFVGEAPRTFSPRAHHTATVINGTVWLIGGVNQQSVIRDYWCFDIIKQRWRQPRLKGMPSLLFRCAHAACAHPGKPGSILIFGGYTTKKERGIWLNDLIEVDTEKNMVREIDSGGSQPAPRGYHSFTRMGNFCISAFGRGADKTLIPRSKCLAILDTLSMTWTETSGNGNVPIVRYSHRATAFDQEFLLLFGGIPDSRESKERLNILSVLRCDGVSFSWQNFMNSASLESMPGRSAHCQEQYQDTLFIVGGYTKSPPYAGQVVKLRLVKTQGRVGCRDVDAEFPMLSTSSIQIPESELRSAEGQHSGKRQNEHMQEDYSIRDSQIRKLESDMIKRGKMHAMKASNVDWETEANIADRKWREAAARCSQLEMLAEESKSKADAALQKQITLEKNLAGMNNAVNDIIDQIYVDCSGHESLPNVARSIPQTQKLSALVQYLLQKKNGLTNSCKTMQIKIGENIKEIEELKADIHEENELRVACLNKIDTFKHTTGILVSDFTASMDKLEHALTAKQEDVLSRDREIEFLKMENRKLQSQILEQDSELSHLRSSYQEIEKMYKAQKEQTEQLSQKWLKVKEEMTKSLDEMMR